MAFPTNNDLPNPFADEDYDDEKEFNPCLICDGHPACEDHGCAIELGLGRMVKKNIEPGNDDWG